MKAKLPSSLPRRGVIISGAHGLGNIGDDAALSGILSDLRSLDPSMPVCVLSRNPKETAETHGVESIHSFRIFKLLSRLKRSSLFISGGGSLIQDVTSTRSLLYYLLCLRLAKAGGCSVMMYGCGIGPVKGKRNRLRCGKCINRCVDAITLRDTDSLEELRALGVERPEISLSCDPAMLTEKATAEELDSFMESRGLKKDGRYLCFCLRSWEGFGEKAPLFGSAADYALERHGLESLFFSLNFKEDAEAARTALAHCKGSFVSITQPMSAPLAAGLISRMRALVSMRLHPLIFAAGSSVPSVGIVYDPKVSAFLRYIGQENFAQLDTLEEEELFRLIDTAVGALPAAFGKGADKIELLKLRSRDAAAKLLANFE